MEMIHPNFVIYNAGTDIMENDPLGRLSITREGIIQRDFFVFSQCRERKVPILMLTSGGYQRSNADVIADSIANLFSKGVISKQSSSLAGTQQFLRR